MRRRKLSPDDAYARLQQARQMAESVDVRRGPGYQFTHEFYACRLGLCVMDGKYQDAVMYASLLGTPKDGSALDAYAIQGNRRRLDVSPNFPKNVVEMWKKNEIDNNWKLLWGFLQECIDKNGAISNEQKTHLLYHARLFGLSIDQAN